MKNWINTLPLLIMFFVIGCSSGSGESGRDRPPAVVDEVDGDTILYSGPAPSTEDIQNFKLSLWDNLAHNTRCGECHVENNQSPEFVRRDDINLAFAAANNYVDLNEPGNSRLVTKVASGHGCWTENLSFCEEKVKDWITDWASSSGVELTETALEVPDVFDVSASLTFPEDTSAFGQHVYPLLESYCADCHRADAPQAPVQPFFASRNLQTAYVAAQNKMLFNVTENNGNTIIDGSRSRLVLRLSEEAHNCWDNNCVTSSIQMENALEAFAANMELRDLDATLVTSKAMRIGDGTAISQGGRVETNAIAIYPFKAGAGNVANDYSDGFPPALDLNLSGDVEWVSNWGIRLNSGRAQAAVSSSSKLHRYITQTGEYSIEAWIVPANVTQDGPARIVSYSGSDIERNFTLGQTMYNYNVANRSASTNQDGMPLVSTPDADEVLQATLQHVVVNYDPLNGRRLFVNGVEEISADPSLDAEVGGSLANWDDGYAFVLGNETSGLYPWRGTIRFLAIHNRVLTPEQVIENYDVGVGQKILVAFSIADHIPGMSDAYIVFQIEQFDDYSYLFSSPYFFSFTETPSSDITIQGLYIGVNGREANVGQAYANLDLTISASDYTPEGVPLSNLGTIIELEKGAEQDQFFLSFDQIGQSTFNRPDQDYPDQQTPQDIDGQPDEGVKTFADINASLSAMTGVPVTNAQVMATYEAVKQQMPPTEDMNGFLVAHQMGITQLAVKYCNVLANDSARMSVMFSGFTGSFDDDDRDALVDPLLSALIANVIPAEGVQLSNQPIVSEVKTDMDTLIDTMTAGCSGSCSSTIIANTVTAVCAATLGSAVMLVQ